MLAGIVSRMYHACVDAPFPWRVAVIGGFFASAMMSAYAAAPSHQAEWCERLAVRLPGISTTQCLNSKLTATGSMSVKGFPILARHIPALEKPGVDTAPVRILLVGGIHGDELTSSSIVFKWLQLIQETDAREFHWNVIPVLNPDGLLARKPNRVNANGVDLNRNFPTPGWHQDAPRYWAKRTRKDPRRYPGKAPLSEPESRLLYAEMERFHPQVIISVHAPFGVLDFDGPTKPPRRFGGLVLNQVGVYPGSLGNYSGMHKKIPVITIELPNARTLPSNAEARRIWRDMLNWIQLNVPKKPKTKPKQSALLSASLDQGHTGISGNGMSVREEVWPEIWRRISHWLDRTFFNKPSR